MTAAAPACKQEPGVVFPIVDLQRCEGKGDCERVCPENVFEVRRIADDDYRELGLLHKFKLRVHGMRGRLYAERRCVQVLRTVCRGLPRTRDQARATLSAYCQV